MIAFLSILFLIIVAFSVAGKKDTSKENKKNIEIKVTDKDGNEKKYSGEITEDKHTDATENAKKILLLYD